MGGKGFQDYLVGNEHALPHWFDNQLCSSFSYCFLLLFNEVIFSLEGSGVILGIGLTWFCIRGRN